MATRTLTVNLVGRTKNLERAFDRTSRSANSMAGGISKAVGGAGRAMLGLGAVFAGGAFAAKQFVDVAVDVEESLSKNTVVFGDSADAIEKFANTASDALGMSRRQALEATGTFGTLAAAMKLPQSQAAEMATTMTALAADMASFNNASPEETLLALQSGLRGEAEPLRRFGVLLDAATLKQEALAQGLIESDKTALTPVQKALAAYSVILEQTKIQQGDFERTSDGLANKQRILSARFEDVKEKLGAQLLPVFEAVTDWLVTSGIPHLEDFSDTIGEIWTGEDLEGIAGVASDFRNIIAGVVEDIQADLPMHESLAARIGSIWGNVTEPIAEGIQAGLDSVGNWISNEGGFLQWADELDENIADWIGNTARDFWHGWMTAIGVEGPTQEEIDRIARKTQEALNQARNLAFQSTWDALSDEDIAAWLGFSQITDVVQKMVDDVRGKVAAGETPTSPAAELWQDVANAMFGTGVAGGDVMGPFNPAQTAQIDAATAFISGLGPATSTFSEAHRTGLGPGIVVNMPPGSDGDDVVNALSRWTQQNGPLPPQIIGTTIEG